MQNTSTKAKKNISFSLSHNRDKQDKPYQACRITATSSTSLTKLVANLRQAGLACTPCRICATSVFRHIGTPEPTNSDILSVLCALHTLIGPELNKFRPILGTLNPFWGSGP